MVFERKVLKKIFGPTNKNGIWRIKTNQELDKIIKRKNIINSIRAQRLGWLGHIERMQRTRIVKAIYCWKPVSRRAIGRPKTRRENDVFFPNGRYSDYLSLTYATNKSIILKVPLYQWRTEGGFGVFKPPPPPKF